MIKIKKINYGVDAPKVIRSLFLIGIFLLCCSLFLDENLFPPLSNILSKSSLFPGITFTITGTLMILYAKFGKFKHRDRILNLHNWKGNEQVLDVGTGLGLLMIGAAKKLTTGKSFGIDIFNTYDLSNNSIEQTKINVELESVESKVEILKESILETSFKDNSFDVIVSNLCLHNLYKKEERKKGCIEIHRILKTNGKAIISDFKNTKDYIDTFKELGMEVKDEGIYFFDTFPPLRIIVATKK
ncbi:MAG: class I SAM-dependent methyltransferase [Bacteroidia bacterium]